MTRTIEQQIGQRVREQRERLGLTQEQLGGALGRYLRKPWSRQAVYAAEKGGRDFRAVDLLGLSQVLGIPVGWLCDPISEELEMPSGTKLAPEDWPGADFKGALENRDEALASFLVRLDQVVDVTTSMVLKAAEGLLEVRGQLQQLVEEQTGWDLKGDAE